jgi:starch phosphorylase
MVAVSLVSRCGYFRQTLTSDGQQREASDVWDPAQHCTPLNAKLSVSIDGRDVWVGAWLYVVAGQLGSQLPLVLLDTDLHENHPSDRELTHYLYGGDDSYRLKQEIVLGIGGVRMLRALGLRIRQYHSRSVARTRAAANLAGVARGRAIGSTGRS